MQIQKTFTRKNNKKMSIINDFLALDLPTAVNRCLLMGRQLDISMKFEPKVIPNDIKVQLFAFLMESRKQARNYQARQCYFNAQMVLLASLANSQFKGRIKYCEGLYATSKIPFAIPHAWNVLDNEYVVDTTMVTDVLGSRKSNLSDRFIGSFPNGHEYEGISIDTDFVVKRLETEMESISLFDDYSSGFSYMKELEKRLREM